MDGKLRENVGNSGGRLACGTLDGTSVLFNNANEKRCVRTQMAERSGKSPRIFDPYAIMTYDKLSD